jgi:hypothetical protein
MEIMLLKDSISQLQSALAAFTNSFNESTSVFVASKPGEFQVGEEGIQLATAAITDLFTPEHAADGRYTSICVGAIGVDEETIERAKYVNLCKDRLIAAVQIANDRLCAGVKSKSGKSKMMRALLKQIGWGRLSLRLCYRHLPVLDYQPYRIGFSYSSGGKSIKKLSVAQAMERLMEAGYESDQAKCDYEFLANQQADLTLASVQPLAGYYKANVFAQKGSKPKTMAVYLPIIYLSSGDEVVQHSAQLSEKDDWKRIDRKTRTDSKLDPNPIITSLPVHSYMI